MNIKELKQKIESLPDDMPVLLLAYGIDSPDSLIASVYEIKDDQILVGNYFNTQKEALGKALWIGFKPK